MQFDNSTLKVETHYLAEQYFDIFVSGQDFADGCRDLRRRQASRCDLVEQWLKGVMVFAIHQRDLHRQPGQCFGRLQSAEASTDDYDSSAILVRA